MGEQDITAPEGDRHRFTRDLLRDVRALEVMLREDRFERGVRRIGAEQELFLVDRGGHPAMVITDLLAASGDPRLTTEVARFNAEFNLDPLLLEGDCLGRMERQVEEMLAHVRGVAEGLGAEVVLIGTLPTARPTDLTLESMTPRPRYRELNDRLTRLRNGPYEFTIRGTDELVIRHDSLLLEACNTSFQVHLQVDPDEFARFYNIAQVAAAPVLAAAANSPLLFGRRLWAETRIALFQQSVDTRSSDVYLRELAPRVSFGSGWVRASVLEIFKEDIARFPSVMAAEHREDPFEALDRGEAPRLYALKVHNSTVYRWNRACYGVLDGRPHLRIENRILPAGPTPLDEMANAALWLGLVLGLADDYPDITRWIEFDDAKSNFIAAARSGMASQLVWLSGLQVPVRDLLLQEVIPIARAGLERHGLEQGDVDRYLGVIRARVTSRQTGAQWQLQSLARMRGRGTPSERMGALVAATIERQRANRPVHVWPLAELEEAGYWQLGSARVEHYMATDLFTVHEDEPVDLVLSLMEWRSVGHVPVEDEHHRLIGLVTRRGLQAAPGGAPAPERGAPLLVREVMQRDVRTVTPETPAIEALALLREGRCQALPVLRHGRLVGLVTERDLRELAQR